MHVDQTDEYESPIEQPLIISEYRQTMTFATPRPQENQLGATDGPTIEQAKEANPIKLGGRTRDETEDAQRMQIAHVEEHGCQRYRWSNCRNADRLHGRNSDTGN